MLTKANAAGYGLLNAHDQSKQRALPAPIGACNTCQLPFVTICASPTIAREGGRQIQHC